MEARTDFGRPLYHRPLLTIGLNNVATKAKLAGETELVLAIARRRVEVLDRRARDQSTVPGSMRSWRRAMRYYCYECGKAGRWEEATKASEKARVRLAENDGRNHGVFRQVSFFH